MMSEGADCVDIPVPRGGSGGELGAGWSMMSTSADEREGGM